MKASYVCLLLALICHTSNGILAQSKTFKPGADFAIADSAEVWSNEVSVFEFGAVGDGKTNDTKSFQRAIAAARGRTVKLYGKKFAVNLVLSEGGCSIEGGGALLVPAESEKPVITMRPATYMYNVKLRNFEIKGRNRSSDGIYIVNNGLNNGTDNISLEQITVTFCRYAVNVEGRSIWNKIYSCRFDWNTGGLRVKTPHPCNLWDVTASTFNYNDQFGVWIENENASKAGFKNFKFQSCNMEGNGETAATGIGAHFDGMEMLILENLYVEGNCPRGEGYGIRMAGKLGRGFTISGGWYGDCKYPIVIEGEKMWGSLQNLMATSNAQNSSADIIIRSRWLNNEPKIEIFNCLARVDAEEDAQGNTPLHGIDWEPLVKNGEIDMQYRSWLKLFNNSNPLVIRKINGLRPGRRIGIINHSPGAQLLTIDKLLMSDGKPYIIQPNNAVEFLVDGYPTTGKLRVIGSSN